MCVKIHTVWFRKSDGEAVSAEAMTFSNAGIEDIKAAFADNSHFIGVVSEDQTVEQNEAILLKVGSPIQL